MAHHTRIVIRNITIAAAFMLLAFTTAPIGAFAQRRTEVPASPIAQQTVGQQEAQQALARQKPVFIANKGQWDRQAKFLLRSPGMDLWITDNGVVYDINRVEPIDNSSSSVRPHVLGATDDASIIRQQEMAKVTSTPVFITYEGASRGASAVGDGKLPHYHNYYIGNDRTRWASGVPLYSDARVRGLYNGIDALFYLDNGRPRYDLVVSPGADPAKIRMKIDGATNVSVASNGTLRIATSLGVVEQRELFAYQEINGEKRKVQCGFRINGDGRVSFATGRYDRSRPLVIDPLVYSTYLGGSSDEMYGGSFAGVEGSARTSGGIAVDGSGNAYIVGTTSSSNFPTLNAADGSRSAVYNAFVTKLTSSGSISYSTYLGGSDDNNGDQGVSIAVDGSSNAYVTGWTFSSNFPTLNAFQSSKSGGMDVFITKLTSSGSLSFSSYLGGSFNDRGYGITVDGSSNIYVVGFTGSGSFPGTSGTGTPGFMTKISGGSISFSKYLTNQGRGIAVDGSGNIYVAGTTNTSGTSQDVFAMKFTSSGSVSYSVTFGGSGTSALDVADGIAVDGSGNAYITGYTNNTNFPTQNAAQSTYGGNDDAFVTKLTSSGSVSYSTYLGSSSQEYGNGIAVDANGNAYVTGVAGSGSASLTTSDALQRTAPGNSEGFVARLTSSGVVTYYTLLGGSDHDHAEGIAIDGGGNVYVTGWTASNNFPTQNAAQSSRAGAHDAFVTKLLINSITSLSISNSSPYCAGSTVAINWASSGVSSVNIDFSTDGGTNWSSVATSQTSGTSGGTYYWTVANSAGSNRKVRVSDAANSSVSATSSLFTINAPPSVTDDPDNVTTTAFPSGGVSFSASAGGTAPITMQWELSTNNGASWSPISGATSSTFTLGSASVVTARSGYRFRIAFTNSCATVYSQPATLTVTKATASVTLSGLSHTYDGSAKSATATTSPSGLTVNIGYAQNGSPVAAPTNAGDYDVTATINDANYAGSTTGTLTIGKVTLTVTADDKQRNYGGANPTFTASYSGFVNNEGVSVLSGSPSLSTSATASSNIGDYTITAAVGSLAATNYQFTFENGILSVVPVALTVTVVDAEKVYGTANPAFTASYNGFVNDDDAGDLTGTLAFSTAATTSSGRGTYDVTASGLTSDNYEITFIDGELEITRAALMITADDKTKTYGDANPAFTLSYDGFVLGEDEGVLGGTADFSTSATASSDVGEYAISPSGLTSDNYEIAFVDGELEITRAGLTVTADDKSRIYGDADPTFSASYSGFVNGDDESVLSGSPSLSTTASATSDVGDYSIAAGAGSLDADNYSFSFVDGTLSITTAPLTVTADDKEKSCGESNPTLTGTIDGIRNDDEITASYSTTATSSSGAGDYVIAPSASGTKLSNYTPTYVNGTLTVNPPAITGHPDDQDIVAGSGVSFSASTSGTASVQWQLSTDAGVTWANISGATSTTLSFTTSSTQSGNQYRAVFDNGTCASATFPATLTLKVNATDLGPAVLFLGVVNNIDNNRNIDLKVELYKNSTLISSGELSNEKLTGPNQNSARKYTVPLTMTNGAVSFGANDQLKVKVYGRRNGGSNNFPALLWYNDSPTPSINQGNKGWCRVGAETEGGTNTGYFYLRSSSALNISSGSSGQSIEQTLGTSWVLFDTWTMYGSSMKPVTTEAVTGRMTAQVVPNPLYATVAMLRLTVSKPGDAIVTLHDPIGRQMLQLPAAPIEQAGEVMLPLDLSSLPSGVYTVRIAMEDETITTSITVVR
jgi:hypothetical protein